MEQLFLEDLKGKTDEEVRDHLVANYSVSRDTVDLYDILLAYESVGSWGCDSNSYFLLRDKITGDLFETYASHCSCYGFEDQFSPEAVSVEYLQSDKHRVSLGGYDNSPAENERAIVEFLKSAAIAKAKGE